jgi:hypothetical protein
MDKDKLSELRNQYKDDVIAKNILAGIIMIIFVHF